jgi:mono/diheme cytochrome c family protein
MIAAVVAALVAATASPKPADNPRAVPAAQADYLLYCGGCHGIDGRSSDRLVPTLRDQVGAFRCSAEARDYVGRLPNIAFAPLDDERLSALLNYVFSMDSHAYRKTEPPFTPQVVSALRRHPLVGAPIAAYRQKLADKLISECGGSPTLRRYGR